ncbi:2-oxoadipate dioxygenase/decarboxylase HglS [Croceicoccus naphthovorans]|uniref:2-oxoadipate dioxygenase/decarboxylase n=1 Tax=Croceicoccus naphthovorans TaxID=1348774 RepID=A0A0G3XCJ2_9SPHN|nr:VOC family protein [Croceicoccus naphthovorans]AKM08912.1 hypothetical protein AB433_01255 [Croceicoccus naphthovorans]MBB3989312.1 putative glyoxalase superfamily metalloenzyme YdcJ [Croceicoccus naphthovorans]
MPAFASPCDIRAAFSQAMSAMYRAEVPLYGDLLDIVADVNARVPADGDDPDRDRLGMERHGAIRVGTAEELRQVAALFRVMGMEPVGYYDLSVAGIPVHSTAFRPVTAEALGRSPFRVFTSMLRLEMIEDADLRAEAKAILSGRRIVTDRAMALAERAAANGGLTAEEAKAFVAEALETFRWRREARVSAETYARLNQAHRLIADIVSFPGPHINHLTPRTLDIDAAQTEMLRRGLPVKESIEGPPRRKVPILLRQTSFKALDEAVVFAGNAAQGTHTARFGEIEQRGVALTPKGRTLYDACLARAASEGAEAAFADFPDDADALRSEGLAYFSYASGQPVPITYEDFLPVSAAGIFRSNLGDEANSTGHGNPQQAAFESALGRAVLDPFTLYAEEERRSRTATAAT